MNPIDHNNSHNFILRHLDVNVNFDLQGKDFLLPVPLQKPKGAWKDLHHPLPVPRRELEPSSGVEVPLTYNELKKGLRNALLRVEVMSNGNAEHRRRLLLNEFSRLHRASSDEVKQILDSISCDFSLSRRVLHVLHLRRHVLCTGFESGLGELKEWLSLAMLLGESGVTQFIEQYAQKLGPHAQQQVGDVMFMRHLAPETLFQAILDIPTPEGMFTPFSSRYYNIVLDDLIVMADEPPQPMAFQLMQRDLTVQARELHVEWMLQLSMASNLKLETFFLAVSILDHYLLKIPVSRERFHLICCASLLLASKQEEIFPLPLRTLLRYSGERFTLEMLVSTECHIFALLGFDVVYATLSDVGMGFLAQQDPVASEQQRCFVMYILSTLAIRTHYMQYRYSSLAAAAVYASRLCFGIPTGEPCDEVQTILPALHSAVCRNRGVNPGGVYDIFSRTAFHKVSEIKLHEFM